jgi:hypothetical protein
LGGELDSSVSSDHTEPDQNTRNAEHQRKIPMDDATPASAITAPPALWAGVLGTKNRMAAVVAVGRLH